MDNEKKSSLPARVPVRTASGFGEFVRASRIQGRMTQEQLARKAGRTRRWLQDVERGRVALSLPAAIDLANALGYDIVVDRSEPSSLLDQVFGDLT